MTVVLAIVALIVAVMGIYLNAEEGGGFVFGRVAYPSLVVMEGIMIFKRHFFIDNLLIAIPFGVAVTIAGILLFFLEEDSDIASIIRIALSILFAIGILVFLWVLSVILTFLVGIAVLAVFLFFFLNN